MIKRGDMGPHLLLRRSREVTVQLEEAEQGGWIRFATLTASPTIIRQIVDRLMSLESVRAVNNGKVYYP